MNLTPEQLALGEQIARTKSWGVRPDGGVQPWISTTCYWNDRRNTIFVASGSVCSDGSPQSCEFNRHFPTVEEARACADALPKGLKARAYTVHDHPNRYGAVYVSARLKSDGVNKGQNEAGIKRLKLAARHLTFEFAEGLCSNFLPESVFRELIK